MLCVYCMYLCCLCCMYQCIVPVFIGYQDSGRASSVQYTTMQTFGRPVANSGRLKMAINCSAHYYYTSQITCQAKAGQRCSLCTRFVLLCMCLKDMFLLLLGPGAMADLTSIVNRVLKNLERINGISHSDPVESCSLDTSTI